MFIKIILAIRSNLSAGLTFGEGFDDVDTLIESSFTREGLRDFMDEDCN